MLTANVVLACFTGGVLFQTAHEVAATRPASHFTIIEPRISALVDMHYWVRARAAGDSAKPGREGARRDSHEERAAASDPKMAGIEGMDQAISVVRDVGNEVGGPLAWGIIEAPLSGCDSAVDAAALADKLPEEFRSSSGHTLRLRENFRKIAQAYGRIEPHFRRDVWAERERRIRDAWTELERGLAAHETACFERLLKDLGMTDPKLRIPVYLVVDAPRPQAFTHRSRGGGGVCFVGIDAADGTQLIETVLHECTHTLDIATASQNTVLQELRERLGKLGLEPSSRTVRDVPHTLMFVEAGETVRRVIDRSHRHYGDVEGYYARLPDATRAVRGPWTEHLDGTLSREAAMLRITEEVRAVQSQPK